MNALPDVPADALPITDVLREQLLMPVLAAVETALREVAMTEVTEHAAYRLPARPPQGELVAVLELSSMMLARLALGFSKATAAVLARRVLVDTQPNPDAALVNDCLGELVNVSAGQAKALLHGTPWQFSFATPRVTAESATSEVFETSEVGTNECLVALLSTDVGVIIVQLFLTSASPRA